jgi:hypothetical protein
MAKFKRNCLAAVALFVFSAMLFFASCGSASAQANWSLSVSASSGIYSSTSIFGVQSGAISGWDPVYDQVVPPAPPTGVYSYFFVSANSVSPVDLQDLSTSLNPAVGSWVFCVENMGATGVVTVSWVSGDIVTSSMTLTPSGGSATNMLTVSQYSWTATQNTVYTFTVTAENVARGSSGPLSNSSPSPSSSTSPTLAPVNHEHPWYNFWWSWGNWKLPSFSFGGSGTVAVSAKITVYVLAVAAVLLVVAAVLRRRKR